MSGHDDQGPWARSGLVRSGISSREIPGLYTSEDHSIEECIQRIQSLTKETYTHAEIFGQYCHLGEYIHAPVDLVYEYAANVYSLEEWTYSLRDLRHLGGGLYKGREALANDTTIYVRSDAYPDSRVVDYLCAWDQGDELWMRYYFRFIDALPTIRKPGTIVLWTNCKHPYYDRGTKELPGYISEPRARKDRAWVGDIWPQFDAIHKIEIANLKAILEFRYAA